MATITSANAEYSLSVSGLFPVPQVLQGYAADDGFTSEAVVNAETVMGLDGHLSGGFVFNPVKQTITIMPDSPSLLVFQQWANQQYGTREVIIGNASIAIPSIGQTYVLTRGFLTSYMPIPDVKKILQPVKFEITWGSVVGAPI